MQIKPIAYIKTDFSEKFGIPRQSGRVPSLKGTIVFEPEFRDPDYIRGMEEFSHLWLLWEFSANGKHTVSATVRPPRLGGNERRGVFATRSPFRPNPIGLSCVKLDGIVDDEKCGKVLLVSGVDILNGTPIFDIKPYIPHSDLIENAVGGFADREEGHKLNVIIPGEISEKIPKNITASVIGILAEDPRPAYQNDADRKYGISFAGYNISFYVKNQDLFVTGINKK